jgi:hypothetical protein
LQLLILELGRIEGWVIHEGVRVEHGSTSVRVEMVEASGIVILLDGGVVHPGAHVCGTKLELPICGCDKTLAIQYFNRASIERLEARRKMTAREVETRRDGEVATGDGSMRQRRRQ